EGEEDEDDDGEDDGEEVDEEEIDLEAEMAADQAMAEEEGVYVLAGNPRAGIGGPDDDMPPELDWGADETFTRQYIGAINAQEGWDAGHLGGAAGAAAAVAVAAAGGGGPVGAAAIHTFAHHLGPGDVTGNEGWLRGSAEDQLRLWGVQPPPGLARQYATTRHGDRGGAGVNVMTMSDFIESDSALSQMLRSVNPPGVMGTGPSPVVRIVRGAGADGRWTETQMITHEIHTPAPGPSLNTTRLFPDGPSAATQAHTAPVVHPLLMGQPRGATGAAGTTRSSGRGSRGSRGSTGGGSSANARQQLLGLLPNERLIWDGHAGAPLPEGTLIDAIEGLNVVVNQPFGTTGAGAQQVAGGAGDGGRAAPGHPSSSSSAARRASAGVAGAGGPPMANEGRWTDNGQPLTAAEGRTVLPMLDQVELAVAARLLPAARQTNAAATPTTEQPENGEEKEEQEESKEEGATSAGAAGGTVAAANTDGGGNGASDRSSSPPQPGPAVSAAMSVIDSLLQPGSTAGSTAAAREESVSGEAEASTEGATAMAVEDAASVSEGEAVAALASSLSLSPRRDDAATEARSAAPTSPATVTPTATAAPAGNAETAPTVATPMESQGGAGDALAAILHGSDQAAAAAAMGAAGGAATSTSAADAMDVEDEDGSGVEESKGDESDAAGTTEQEASARDGAAATAGDVPSAAASGDDHMEEEG
ncbi:unnamed protein product, partial [Sphacelaria rigidula]